MPRSEQYDVALSFAGENRKYVRSVAEDLRTKGVGVFYDEFEEIALWGEDLTERFVEVSMKGERYKHPLLQRSTLHHRCSTRTTRRQISRHHRCCESRITHLAPEHRK